MHFLIFLIAQKVFIFNEYKYYPKKIKTSYNLQTDIKIRLTLLIHIDLYYCIIH